MSEIQLGSDPYWLRWALVGAISAINILIRIIWRSMKKDIDKIRRKQDKDHDRLNEVITKVEIYHPEK